ncbi:hypothetical protein SAMN05216266_1497 [Amycolatopsis marina]|uniref:Uncharacterized protein n=1 Tax=Amycolatopsis marina TaxID=490629 RepID=A0A1I1CQM8_9PSEU|nr:hypothetical protein [Prauserella muralis]SFB64844.1 hypothetical protein SAMN05216266_1497 [Amycolatopsis marina]
MDRDAEYDVPNETARVGLPGVGFRWSSDAKQWAGDFIVDDEQAESRERALTPALLCRDP